MPTWKKQPQILFPLLLPQGRKHLSRTCFSPHLLANRVGVCWHLMGSQLMGILCPMASPWATLCYARGAFSLTRWLGTSSWRVLLFPEKKKTVHELP